MNSLNSLHSTTNTAARGTSAGQLWHAALGELQLQMTKATFDTWVKPTFALAYEEGTLVVGVRNAYAKQWLENRLYGMIQRTLNHILGRSAEVRFILNPEGGFRGKPREAGSAFLGEQDMDTTQDFSASGPARVAPNQEP